MQDKAEHLHIRTTGHEKAILTQAALAKNMSLSQFILQTAMPVAEEIVKRETGPDQTLFKLESSAWEEFISLLDSPNRDIPELRKLLETQAPWEL